MPPEVSAGLDDFRKAHAALLAWLHAQSKASRWSVSREEFSAALYRSAAHRFGGDFPSGESLELYLRGLHLEEIAMACALRLGSEQAWEEFIANYRPALYAAARAIVTTAGEARARELADGLYADLYGVKSPAGQPRRPLLDYFHGRSKLSTWLRAVLAQRHVDFLRAAQRTESLTEDGAAEFPADGRRVAGSVTIAAHTSSHAGDPNDPDRQKLLPRLQHAVSQALAGLASTDRLLLSLYYVEDLTLAQIARLRGVHEATVSRHIARIARELRESVERALLTGAPARNGSGGQAGLSPAQVERCFAFALEDWPLDLRRELSAGGARVGREEST
jgi:RNA polymerase sigma factor (sigma-70 family)